MEASYFLEAFLWLKSHPQWAYSLWNCCKFLLKHRLLITTSVSMLFLWVGLEKSFYIKKDLQEKQIVGGKYHLALLRRNPSTYSTMENYNFLDQSAWEATGGIIKITSVVLWSLVLFAFQRSKFDRVCGNSLLLTCSSLVPSYHIACFLTFPKATDFSFWSIKIILQKWSTFIIQDCLRASWHELVQ